MLLLWGIILHGFLTKKLLSVNNFINLGYRQASKIWGVQVITLLSNTIHQYWTHVNDLFHETEVHDNLSCITKLKQFNITNDYTPFHLFKSHTAFFIFHIFSLTLHCDKTVILIIRSEREPFYIYLQIDKPLFTGMPS